MADYRYYRFTFTQTDGLTPYTSLSQIELFDALGNHVDLTSGGTTVSASSENSGAEDANNAVDNSDNSEWLSDTGASLPQWFKIDFGVTQTVEKFSLKSQRIVTGRTATYWYVEGSNDDTTWDLIHSYEYDFNWAILEKRVFDFNGDIHYQGSTPTASITASSQFSSSYPPADAFNDTNNNYLDRWVSANGTFTSNLANTDVWWQVEFNGQVTISQLKFWISTTHVKRFEVLASDTGAFTGEEQSSGEITITESNNTTSTVDTAFYTLPTPVAGTFIRINFLENDGTANWVSFNEVTFIGQLINWQIAGNAQINGVNAECTIRLYRKDNGQFVSEILSDSITGDYLFEGLTDGVEYIIMCLPPDAQSGVCIQANGAFLPSTDGVATPV